MCPFEPVVVRVRVRTHVCVCVYACIRACLCVCTAVSNSALTAVGQSQPGCDLSVYLSTFNLSFCFTLFLAFFRVVSLSFYIPLLLSGSFLLHFISIFFLLQHLVAYLNILFIPPSELLQPQFFFNFYLALRSICLALVIFTFQLFFFLKYFLDFLLFFEWRFLLEFVKTSWK